MTTKVPSSQAVTGAHWWGDKLRELRDVVLPLDIGTQSEAEYVGELTGFQARVKAATYRVRMGFYESLTEVAIQRFEELLALHIEDMIAKYSYYVLAQVGEYRTSPELGSALEGAGIPTEFGVVSPVFDSTMATLVDNGKVFACGGVIPAAREPLHELALIV